MIATAKKAPSKLFEIAEESYTVDPTDAEGMKKLIREKKIDAVHPGSAEPVIGAASAYLRELGLPCYATPEQCAVLHEKIAFKELCDSVGLPVVKRIDVDEENLSATAAQIKYPVIAKPVDASGSAGCCVCRNAEEFLSGYDEAKRASFTGKVIVESFVDNRSVYLYYTFSGGKSYFTGVTRKYTVKYPQGNYVLSLRLGESPFIADIRARFEEKLFAMFKKIDLREGVLWPEIFHDGKGTYYFNEAGYRYNSSVSIYMTDFFYGINQLYTGLYFELTGKSQITGHKSLIPASFPRKKHFAMYPIHLKAGTIAAVNGIEDLKSARANVLTVCVGRPVGLKIEDTGTFKHVFAVVQFVFDTKEEFLATLDDVHKFISVKDTDGNEMVNRIFDADKETADFFELGIRNWFGKKISPINRRGFFS